jgi:hypothetical protein
MKKINKIVSLIFLGTLLIHSTGCKKELDAKVFNNLTPDNFFQTEDDLNSAVIALYNPFTSHWGTIDQGAPDGKGGNVWYAALYNSDNKTYLARSIITTDEIPANVWDANLQNFTWGPATFSLTTGTEPTYAKIRYVARATEVISKIPLASKASDVVKAKYLAEAKTMRAWLMYVLYDFFGTVNVKLDPLKLSDTIVTPRPSKEEYCNQIEKDLKEALAAPSSSFSESYNGVSGNWGRASKGLARMLLLKLYMHNKQWDKAEAEAKEIIGKNLYKLLPNYTDIFNNSGGGASNNEVIYAVPSSDASPNWWLAPLFPGDYDHGVVGKIAVGPISGWYGYYMPWSYLAQFDTSDSRRSTIMTSYFNAKGKVRNQKTGMLGAIPMKYTNLAGLGAGPGFGIDVVVFRYAEVLLSLSEAINEQRGPIEAYQYVNMVRKRAGIPDWNSANIPTKQGLRDSLLVERGRELYCEGARRQDLIRHGKYIEYAIKRGATAASLKDTLFPIPISVITEGKGIIQQNPGY